MKQQITVAEKRGKPGSKPEFVYLAGPDAPIESHRQKYKEFKRAGSQSEEYQTVGIYERVKLIRLSPPKKKAVAAPAPQQPKTTHPETVRHHEKSR